MQDQVDMDQGMVISSKDKHMGI
jgi:hypothetical protein